MKYIPLPSTPVNLVELINELGAIFENALIDEPIDPMYKYLAVDLDGETWVYTEHPNLVGSYWNGAQGSIQLQVYFDMHLDDTLMERIMRNENHRHLLFRLGDKNEIS